MEIMEETPWFLLPKYQSLYYAYKRGSVEEIKALLKTKGQNSLSSACLQGLSDVALLLINKEDSSELNIQDEVGRTPLSWACACGLSDVAQLLINKGASFDVKDENGRTPLSLACESGLSYIAQLLINKGASFDATDENGRTPLFWACGSGLSDVAQLLINKGASFNVMDENGCTPLLLACVRGLSDVAEILINKGASFDVKDRDGRTPLSLACENGLSDVAQLLINKGASFDVTDDNGCTPLLLACVCGLSDVAQLLINNGASFDVKDKVGHTPLLLACEKGLSDVAQLLINKGASFDVTDELGHTPLLLACVRGLSDVAQLLINKGASFDVTDGIGRTPLSLACENGLSNVAQLLINKGASFDVRDEGGHTSLSLACENGLSNVAQLLINKGASFDVTDELGRTPLLLACVRGLSDVAQLLINKGANFDATDEDGHTPLFWACVRGLSDVAQLLINKGASFDVTDRTGRTPLLLACENGLSDVAQLLINKGASFDVTNRFGESPLSLANARGLIDVAQMLIKKRASIHATEKSVDIDDLKGEQDDLLVEASEPYQQEQEPSSTMKDKHTEAFVRAIREKGFLSFHMVQCLPFGPPRVGKTCLYHCLLDKLPPGTPLTIDTPGTGYLSTDVLTGRKMIQVKIVMESQQKPAEVIVSKGRKWTEVTSLPEEIAIYLKSIECQCKPQSREIFDNFMSSKTSSENLQASISVLDTVPSKETYELTSSQDENTTKPPLAGNTTLDDTVVKALTEHVSGGNVDMDKVQDLLDKSMTIFYTDTGGQPEFHEVLPALVAGPTIFLLVFSLLEPLNSLYRVTFESAANEYEIYNSSFSVKDVLMQCISSITSYHDAQLRDVGEHQSNANKYTKLSPPPTSVLTVGTHSDLVSKEDIHEVDQELKSVLDNKEIIEYFNEDELIIPINNFKSGDGCKVREVIERVVNRMKAGVSPYKVEIPVHWLGLELYLRQKKCSTVSYSECLELGKKFNIQEEELASCLWFLHYKTGTIRYYSMVNELKDTVITEPNIIFVAVTEFITSTFTLKYANPVVCRNFKTLGLFRSDEVQFIFDRHKKTLGITYRQFIALLSHLNILVPAHVTKFDFFLPCALVHAPESDTDSISGSNDILLMFFDKGFVPKGIFSGLLGSLCKEGWEITYNAKREPQLFRNKVVLSVEIEGLEYSIDCTITATSTNIEFMVVANHKEQMNIQQAVETCMQDVCSRLQYGKVWNFVIICEHPNCRKIDSHFASVDEIKKKAKCMMTKRIYQLGEKKSYFFSKSKRASMAGYSKDLIQIKQKQIRNRTEEPYYARAIGIIFIVGIFGADGTTKDVENVASTFKELNFAVYIERDPTSAQIAGLMKAAAECGYPSRYKYIAFYFAGHGGRDESGKLFVEGLQLDKKNPEILHIEEYIIDPLKSLGEFTRFFFFDCCQTTGNGAPFRDGGGKQTQNPKPYPGILVAYSTNEGQKSFGNRTDGGIWTYYLCKNIRESKKIGEVLSKTFNDVVRIREQFQEPTTVCTDDMLNIVLKQDESLSVHQSDQVLESEHQESTGNSPVSSRSSSEDEKQDSASQPICLPDDSILSPDAPTILAVMDATVDITNWSTLALLLGLSLADFDRIVANEHEASGQQMGIIRKWIDSGTASWAVLVTALKNVLVGKQAVANAIAKKYPKKSKNKRSASDRCLKGGSSHGKAPNKAPKTESILVAREIDAQSNRDSDEDGENQSTERLALCKARKRVQHEPYNTGKGIVSKEQFSADRRHGKQPDTEEFLSDDVFESKKRRLED